ncbi:hypothetical protein LCGC14_1371950 [marine sediment metagenome]|uniref:Gfo/Idh/MocA-like oxidoreductase N-terminal domain-containing protein n=1 Tax=marine sediment metagenome TaxID=412755 RepID=A0A0F9MKE6_9ZZZZ|nr:MAG: 1,5-anhydro-D-fructose reductase [Candidatus Lokiarchaeum sp. GC14_75]
MGYAHLPAYLKFPEKVQLTAVCDIREESAKTYAQKAKLSAIYTDFEKMLKDEDLDAVDICTIHDQHKHNVIVAAEAGKHVLLEKPMATTMQDCRDMVRATEKSGINFLVAQTLRYLPTSQAVLHLIQNQELGVIHAARGDSILKQSLILPHDHWMFDGKRAGGGVLITLSIHIIDLLRYFLGDVKKVFGTCKTTNSLFINGAEDLVSATLEFNNGAIGNIFSSFSTSRTPWNIKYMIYGEDGTLYSNPPTNEQIGGQLGEISISSRSQDREGKTTSKGSFITLEPPYNELFGKNPFVNEILHFVDLCQNDNSPISSGKDNLNTMKIIFGIYKSSEINKPINLDGM